MILVTGANGVVGTPLCRTLSVRKMDYMSVSRRAVEGTIQWDLEQAISLKQLSHLANIKTLIHCAPLWLLPKHLPELSKTALTRLVVFSSTSVKSKRASSDSREQVLVTNLAEAEQSLIEQCKEFNLALTILRPSMIYGYGLDQNVMHIAKFIAKYGIMILAGKGQGHRQPVHADDLVGASLFVLDKSVTYGRSYDLAGKEILSYRRMVERVFSALAKEPRIVCIPVPLFRFALRLASVFTRFSYTAEMADRMNQNLSYDITPAQDDFAYAPQNFLEQPERDLVGLR